MSDYFEDNYGFDLQAVVQDAIADENTYHQDDGVVCFSTTQGDITFDFNACTVSFEGDVVRFSYCPNDAIETARTQFAVYEPLSEMVKPEPKKIAETYSEAFNDISTASESYKGYANSRPYFSVEGPAQLTYQQTSLGPDRYYVYNFLTRVLIVSTGSSESGSAVIPFSKLDKETLVAMREKLIELGGTPPPLPEQRDDTRQPKFRTSTP